MLLCQIGLHHIGTMTMMINKEYLKTLITIKVNKMKITKKDFIYGGIIFGLLLYITLQEPVVVTKYVTLSSNWTPSYYDDD